MKRILTICLVALFTFGAYESAYAQKKDPTMRDWARFGRFEKANAEVIASGVRPDAVFMGNSITQNWGSYHADFFTKNNFLCRGISGQTTSHMLVRFRRDVLELNPRSVVIMAGINDLARNNGRITKDNILGNIKSMCELAKLYKIKVILCSITPAYCFRWRMDVVNAHDEIIALNKMIKEYADQNKFTYVDYHSALVDERKGMNRKYHNDEVHPYPICYSEVLEPMILKAVNKVLRTKHSYIVPATEK